MRVFPFHNQVFRGSLADAALVDNLLKLEGIEAIVAPPQEGSRTEHSVYVVDDAQVDRARDIAGRYGRGEPLVDPRSIRSWRCPACNELVEGQFAACWKCGRLKGG
jgi:hypothetical protein